MSGGHFHIISMGGLPEPVRAMLESSTDPEKEKMRHQIQARERADFWGSLNKHQLGYLLGMLGGIAHADDDDMRMHAGRAFGVAEAYMMANHNSCACGELHTDPAIFMDELIEAAKKDEAEKVEAEELGLKKIEPGPFVPEDAYGKFVCRKCKTVFATLEERREATLDDGDSHYGCKFD